MSSIQTKKIAIIDNTAKYINDTININKNNTSDFRKQGYVEIVDKKTGEIVGRSNLIVYLGREIALQRMLDVDREPDSLEKDMKVKWFSIGSGGMSVDIIPIPISPDPRDIGLNHEIVINSDKPDYVDGGRKKAISVEYMRDNLNLQDPLDPNSGRWLIAKTSVLLADNDANESALNEAALWLSNADNTIFKLWAKVTFTTIMKSEDMEVIFFWYLFF